MSFMIKVLQSPPPAPTKTKQKSPCSNCCIFDYAYGRFLSSPHYLYLLKRAVIEYIKPWYIEKGYLLSIWKIKPFALETIQTVQNLSPANILKQNFKTNGDSLLAQHMLLFMAVPLLPKKDHSVKLKKITISLKY